MRRVLGQRRPGGSSPFSSSAGSSAAGRRGDRPPPPRVEMAAREPLNRSLSANRRLDRNRNFWRGIGWRHQQQQQQQQQQSQQQRAAAPGSDGAGPDRMIRNMYRDYRRATVHEEPRFDARLGRYDVDRARAPPFLFSSASRMFAQPPRVVLTSDVAESGIAPELFAAHGMHVDIVPSSLSTPELLDTAADCHLLGVGASVRLDDTFFRTRVGYQPRRLWAIGKYGGGTKNINLEAASARGVACFNARNAASRSMAEKTIADVIALQRRLFTRSNQLHAGRWPLNLSSASASASRAAGDCDDTHECRGRCLGIIGYGRVGSQVGLLAETLGMNVVFYDRREDVLELGTARRLPTQADVLRAADVLTLHSTEVYWKLGAEELGLLRRGACVINNGSSRGICLDSLAASLRSGHVSGAAIDSFGISRSETNVRIRLQR